MSEALDSVPTVVIHLEQLHLTVHGVNVTIGTEPVGKVELNVHTSN